ncbi:Hypothetical predicted protein [Octopus vulgaris]|uniref:Uncharacterized protein n=1 Tax=Octopus vulgaris TaxID=6645 RepID=A0AA36B5K6_OCTVU|nr:Hypothetical predicted protein [Octopus vulgaris]
MTLLGKREDTDTEALTTTTSATVPNTDNNNANNDDSSNAADDHDDKATTAAANAFSPQGLENKRPLLQDVNEMIWTGFGLKRSDTSGHKKTS